MPLSDNVEMVHAEMRPYGAAHVGRNMISGIVTSIDPVSLQNTCKGALAAEFMHQVKPDEYPKPSLPLKATLAHMLGREIAPADECVVKAKAYVDDLKKEGLQMQLSRESNPLGDAIPAIYATKPPAMSP